MIRTEFNGNFGLDEIKKIRLKTMESNSIYDIRFCNDHRIMFTTKLHCFLTDNDEPKRVSDLKIGDKIWVNINDLSGNKINY